MVEKKNKNKKLTLYVKQKINDYFIFNEEYNFYFMKINKLL